MGIEFTEARNKLKVANQRQIELGQSQAKLSEVGTLLDLECRQLTAAPAQTWACLIGVRKEALKLMHAVGDA